MATATRGFAHACPQCGDNDCVTVSLFNVGSLYCSHCDSDLTADAIRDLIAGWSAILKWLETAPTREGSTP